MKFESNATIFIQENEIEIIFFKMVAILSQAYVLIYDKVVIQTVDDESMITPLGND